MGSHDAEHMELCLPFALHKHYKATVIAQNPPSCVSLQGPAQCCRDMSFRFTTRLSWPRPYRSHEKMEVQSHERIVEFFLL